MLSCKIQNKILPAQKLQRTHNHETRNKSKLYHKHNLIPIKKTKPNNDKSTTVFVKSHFLEPKNHSEMTTCNQRPNSQLKAIQRKIKFQSASVPVPIR
jgi:hypothetical protein